MKVKFHGFRLEAGDGFSLDEFAEILSNSDVKTQHEFNDHKRIFLFEDQSDKAFYTGLLITIKDQRKFCELFDDGKKLRIKVSELEKGSELMDFNFFVIHKKTFCGMYQHYHASCSPVQFCIFLREFFWNPERDHRVASKAKEILKAKKVSAEAAEALARKDFKKSLGFDLMYKEEDFVKLMKGMKEIKAFQFDVSYKAVDQDALLPQKVDIKTVQRKVRFEKTNAVKDIAASIADLVRGKDIKKGKVVAIDPVGEEAIIKIDKNIDGFGEFEFDDVASDAELDVEGFAGSPVVKNLLAAAKKNKALFAKADD